MEEFKNDLIELFKKHGIIVLEDSVAIDISPLICDGSLFYSDFIFKFSKVIVDTNEIAKHIENYGLKINKLYD